MIKLIAKGKYRHIVTQSGVRMLYLGKQGYFWVNVPSIGELLVFNQNPLKVSHVLAYGEYRIYMVKNEPHLIDLLHRELYAGKKKWQGYLLLTGLPTLSKIRSRILPTDELITKGRKLNKEKKNENIPIYDRSR